jgi:hypothetical protein
MDALAALTGKALLVFIILLAALTFGKMLTGSIRVQGLIHDRRTGRVNAARIQLLLATLAGAIEYLGECARPPAGNALPDPPTALLAVLGGSQLLYAGNKAFPRLAQYLAGRFSTGRNA